MNFELFLTQMLQCLNRPTTNRFKLPIRIDNERALETQAMLIARNAHKHSKD